MRSARACNRCRIDHRPLLLIACLAQVSALGLTATFQVLLGEGTREGDESALSRRRNNPTSPYSLHRVEVAALITYTGKLAEACAVVERFREIDEAAASVGSAEQA
mmetsp:Transcript_63873/g.142557  ORF Transcript_63873/g.142557 Transcript_63873/m.142557 type:complete len:106 (+) Transcript_63873:1045-1362(+)